MKYTKANPLKVFTTFSGYDSQCLALKYQNIPFDLIGWSEIDKYAIQAHNVLFPEYADRNYGDISKIDWNQVSDFDFLTYSSPCTDISTAGRQAGLTEGSGTRSSLLWEVEKAIDIKRPKYLLMENVKGLLNKSFKHHFERWLSILDSYGYDSYYQVMNARDYGIPQNRERIFVVSKRKDLDEGSFIFPEKKELKVFLKDLLEEKVDAKYFIKENLVDQIIERSNQLYGNVQKNS